MKKECEPKLERNVLKIRLLNDAFRKSMLGGRVVITAGIQALPDHIQVDVLKKVQQFDQFSPDNDPRGEHDFFAFDLDWPGFRERIFAKIDYYDRSLRFGSPDPADPAKTTRVLTILLASEY